MKTRVEIGRVKEIPALDPEISQRWLNLPNCQDKTDRHLLTKGKGGIECCILLTFRKKKDQRYKIE